MSDLQFFKSLVTSKIAADLIGLDEEKLIQYALSGYAPCFIREDGIPFFKRKELATWARHNFYTRSNAKDIPFALNVYKEQPGPIVSRVPNELIQIQDLKEYVFKGYQPCIYFLSHASEIVYVGQSINLPKRTGHHYYTGKVFDSVFYINVPRHELGKVEHAFIRVLKPKYNLYGGNISPKQATSQDLDIVEYYSKAEAA